MSFSRVNALGWALYEVLASAQMNTLDINMTKAVDGDAGGTYAPSSKIQWDGDIEWAGVRLPKLVSRSYNRVQPLIFGGSENLRVLAGSTYLPFSGADFVVDPLGMYVEQAYVDTSASHARPVVFLPCPNIIDRSTLIGGGAYWEPNAAGSYPEYRPSFTIEYVTADDGFRHSLTEVFDPTGSGTYRSAGIRLVANYAMSHPVDQSAHPEETFRVQIAGEAGTDATTSLKVYSVFLRFTVTELTPG